MDDMSKKDRAALLAMLDQALRDGERTEPPPTGEEGDWSYGSPETPEPDENGWITRLPTNTGPSNTTSAATEAVSKLCSAG